MILKELRRVHQLHDSGCFIACIAMLKGITYHEAWDLIYPNKKFPEARWITVGMSPEKSIPLLKKIGLTPLKKQIKSLDKLNQTALLLIRWRVTPTLMHGVVYDASTKLFLDPTFMPALHPKTYESQLDSIYYVK